MHFHCQWTGLNPIVFNNWSVVTFKQTALSAKFNDTVLSSSISELFVYVRSIIQKCQLAMKKRFNLLQNIGQQETVVCFNRMWTFLLLVWQVQHNSEQIPIVLKKIWVCVCEVNVLYSVFFMVSASRKVSQCAEKLSKMTNLSSAWWPTGSLNSCLKNWN